MKTINANTKRGRRYLEAYRRSTTTDIYEAYERPSTAKIRANYQCRQQMEREGGHGYKIIGYNCNFFTAAWQTAEGLRVETATYSYIVK